MRRVPALSLLPGDACLAPVPGTPLAPRPSIDPILVRRLLDARVEVALALVATWQQFTTGWLLLAWGGSCTSIFESMNLQLAWPTVATLWLGDLLTAHPLAAGLPLLALALALTLALPWRALRSIWQEKDRERAERLRLQLLTFLVILNVGSALVGHVLQSSLFLPLSRLLCCVGFAP